MSNLKDDFYEYINHDWLETTEIPADMPFMMSFFEIMQEIETVLMEDLRVFASGEREYADKNFNKMISYYKTALNVEERNRLGVQPVKGLLAEIEALNNFEDYAGKFLRDLRRGLPSAIEFEIDVDLKDSNHYALLAKAPKLILPDVTSYTNENAKALLETYERAATALLAKAGYGEEVAKTHAGNAVKFDALLVPVVKSAEEKQDHVGAYNPVEFETFASKVAFLNLKADFDKLFGGKSLEYVVVLENSFYDKANEFYTTENFELFKSWLLVRTLFKSSLFLDEEAREIAFEYVKFSTGQQELAGIEKDVYRRTIHEFSDVVGLYYGKTYFGDQAKKDVLEMIYEVIEMYKERLSTSDWMSAKTAAKAVEKLEGIKPYIGFPDKIRSAFDEFELSSEDNYLANNLALSEAKFADQISAFFEPVDIDLWYIGAHQVDACYDPSAGIICFPAAILQAPFYSLEQSRAANLGGIGAVIAHEITHAFDSNGAKIDLHGNINNWWTDEDFAKFEERVTKMEKLFDGYEVEYGLKVNGKLTVSENIADHGGLTCVTQIAKREGLGLAELFESWARIWRGKAYEQYLQRKMSIDVHSPEKARANRQLSNTDEFYEVYDIKEGDAMYVAPENRVKIW
ncbi:MAG: M13 family metallopeptidase [Lactobacillales bacterium]|jgi:putative endopeptidase|nr:M13 family metallopeptidase [Lactobacillales bacterium]